MSVPTWWEFLILGLAVVYGQYLVSESVVLEWPRDWILSRLDDDKWEAFIECPWCVGWWLSLAVWGAWLALPGPKVEGSWAVGLCVPAALATFCGLVHRTTDSS